MKEKTLKRLNETNGWTYGSSPENNKYYWVTDGKCEPFVTLAQKGAVNGWGNADTWEDFNKQIVAYMPISKPLFKV